MADGGAVGERGTESAGRCRERSRERSRSDGAARGDGRPSRRAPPRGDDRRRGSSSRSRSDSRGSGHRQRRRRDARDRSSSRRRSRSRRRRDDDRDAARRSSSSGDRRDRKRGSSSSRKRDRKDRERDRRRDDRRRDQSRRAHDRDRRRDRDRAGDRDRDRDRNGDRDRSPKRRSRDSKRDRRERHRSSSRERKRRKSSRRSRSRRRSASRDRQSQDRSPAATNFDHSDFTAMPAPTAAADALQARRSAYVMSQLGYTNQDNPYGDPELTKQFVWAKNKNSSRRGFSDRLQELKQVRQRRDEWIKEKEARVQARDEEAQQRESEQYGDLVAKEDEADRIQPKLRSRLRLRNRRPHAVDRVYQTHLLLEERRDPEAVPPGFDLAGTVQPLAHAPDEVLDRLGPEELASLREEAQRFVDSGIDQAFWLPIIRLAAKRPPASADRDRVDDLLRSRPDDELPGLRAEIAAKPAGEPFWQLAAAECDRAIARVQVRAAHKAALDGLGPVETDPALLLPESIGAAQAASRSAGETPTGDTDDDEEGPQLGASERAMTSADEVKVPTRPSNGRDGEQQLRKPAYNNSVRTGFDWNKYNQTHYDSENPPPKTVQGYKFNISYPDLRDPTRTPTYKLEPDPESDEFCIIRFHSGAPYEDIAFRIVNKEWRRGRKTGFRCVFERGQLQLWFSLKRHFYRR